MPNPIVNRRAVCAATRAVEDLSAIVFPPGAEGEGGGDSFDGKLEDNPLNNQSGGTYFLGPWVDKMEWAGQVAGDSFDYATDGAPVNGVGRSWDGFSATWVDKALS